MSIRPVHPFPARMAPELALKSCEELETESVVLDPMIGSGTAARHAAEFGRQAIGFDLDPLAVLISKVWTTPVNDQEIEAGFLAVLKPALAIDPNLIELPWIDDDDETRSFIEYWFGRSQIQEFRCLAYVLLRIALSASECVPRPLSACRRPEIFPTREVRYRETRYLFCELRAMPGSASDERINDGARACALLRQFPDGFHGGNVQFARRIQPHLGLKIADRRLGSGAVHTVYGA